VTARHQILDSLAGSIDRAANTVPQVLDHLNEQRAQISNLAAQDYTATNTSGGGIANPTLTAVSQLDRVNNHNRDIEDSIETLRVCVRMLQRNIDAAQRFRVSREDIELDSERDLLVQCIECQQIRTPRTDPRGGTIDDGRCIDHGRAYDLKLAERQRRKESDDRRARRYGTV
jgi:ABC-type transporter Mla subunit MlaD